MHIYTMTETMASLLSLGEEKRGSCKNVVSSKNLLLAKILQGNTLLARCFGAVHFSQKTWTKLGKFVFFYQLGLITRSRARLPWLCQGCHNLGKVAWLLMVFLIDAMICWSMEGFPRSYKSMIWSHWAVPSQFQLQETFLLKLFEFSQEKLFQCKIFVKFNSFERFSLESYFFGRFWLIWLSSWKFLPN